MKVEAPAAAVLRASKPARPIKVDGDVGEWPWGDKARVAVLQQGPDGTPYSGPKASMLAACDGSALYVALKVALPQGHALKEGGGQYDGDGLELSFQSAEPQSPTPIFVNWGGAGGSWGPVAAGGATPAQMDASGKSWAYAAAKTGDGWSCEWRIPLTVLGPKPQVVKKLLFNIGVLEPGVDQWVVWVGTGAEIYHVERGGVLLLERP